ncbi:MAG: hypothetical protein Salg2KO_06610 [Salibacteraceae bacterium]
MFIGYKNIWRTQTATQGSVTFTAISNSLAGSNNVNMRQLRQSKVDGDRLFAISGDNRFFRSDNVLGSTPTWTELTASLPGSGTLRDVETDPFDNNGVWISRGNRIYKSTTGGTSWTDVTGNLPNLAFNTIVADPLSDGGLYVAGSSGIYYIDNTLTTWVTFATNFPDNVPTRELDIYHPPGNWQGSRIRAATYGRGLWESDLYSTANQLPLAFLDVSIDSSDICSTDTIQLWNNSAYGVDSSKWTISPATGVTYVNGTSDTSMNPQVVIDEVGQYSITLVVENANGSDTASVNNTIEITGGLSFPWFDNFDPNSPCGTGGCVTNCNLSNWTNVTNGTEDDVDWRVDVGGTPSGSTGPSVDLNPGTSTNNYLYLESSGCANQLALLESPCISLENVSNPEVKFGYHMYGWNAWMGDLDVDVLSNGTWTNVWSESGENKGDQWNLDSTNLNAYVGQSIKFRFAGYTGSGWQADLAIDDIQLTAGPKADFIATDTFPCVDQLVNFVDQSTQSPTNWLWTVTPNTVSYVNGTNPTSQNPKMRFEEAGIYQVSLLASNQYSSNTVTKTGYIEVIVPHAHLISNDSNNAFCPEEEVVLNVTDTVFTAHDFYKNDTLVQFGLTTIYTPGLVQHGDQFAVEVTNLDGCMGYSDTIEITIHDSPVSDILSSDDDNEICDGDTVTFSASNALLSNYEFHLNGTSVQSSSTSTYTTDALIANDYVSIEFIDSNGCTGGSDSIMTVVNPIPPTPGIAAILDSLECSIPAEMYRWTFDDSTINQSTQRIGKNGDGIYQVRIYEGGCWSDWSEPFIITGFAGIDDLSIKVYPSPTTDFVYVEFLNAPISPNARIRLIDMAGNLIYDGETNQNAGNPLNTISLRDVASGVYSIVISVNDKNYAVPIVKESR